MYGMKTDSCEPRGNEIRTRDCIGVIARRDRLFQIFLPAASQPEAERRQRQRVDERWPPLRLYHG